MDVWIVGIIREDYHLRPACNWVACDYQEENWVQDQPDDPKECDG